MTEAAIKTEFHPQIEAIFESAQLRPVSVEVKGRHTAILSEAMHARVVAAAELIGETPRCNRVDRGSRPAVVIVPMEEIYRISHALGDITELRGL